MTIKAIIKDNTADPHITPMEVDPTKPDGGTYHHKMIQVWIVSNLSSTALARLASEHYWSRSEITIGILGRPNDIPIPPYCLTLWETTFLNADAATEEKMGTQVRSVLRSLKDFAAFVKNFDDLRPVYMGHEQFLQYIIDSTRVRSLLIEHNSSPMIIFLVNIKSPTAEAEEWEKVRQGLRHIDWRGVHCATVQPRIHDYHCGYCKGLDHPTPQCPLPPLGFHPNTIDDHPDGPQHPQH